MRSRPSLVRFAFVLLLVLGVSASSRRHQPGLVRPAAGLVALVGATVIDGTGADPVANCTIVIDGDRIRAVGPDVPVPEGAERIDLAGRTIVPGLLDMHGHLFTNLGGYHDEVGPFAILYLAGGVTTIFTAGEEFPEEALDFRDAQRAGDEIGTRIYSPGPYFDHSGGQGEGFTSAEGARALFEQWQDRIDGVKVYTEIRPDELAAVVEAAHAAGLRVTGHLGSVTATQAIEIGIDRLEHGLYAMSEFGRPSPSSPFDPTFLEGLADIDFTTGTGAALVETIVASGTVLDPTVVILESLFAGPLELTPDWQRYLAPDAARALNAMNAALASMRAGQGSAEAFGELVEAVLDRQRELIRRVHEKGGKVVAGTDPVFADVLPGYGLHREVEHLVLAGLTELEALRACTLDAAEALGLEKELGSIEAGKLADLVVLGADPTKDITALGATIEVWQAGARYAPAELRESVVGAIE
jgi:imidazolonepropionase-like amidohydrolase